MITLDRETYELCNYVFHELTSGEIVVQNKEGIVRIKDPVLGNLIKEWDTHNGSTIPLNDLNDNFGERAQQALDFLLQYKIIEKRETPNFNLTGINIISNSAFFIEHSKDMYLYDYGDKLNIRFSDYDDIELEKNELVILFLNPYNKHEASEIVKKVNSEENTISLISYVYNNTIYIDSLYSKKWYKPCHFCHIGHIETQLRTNHTGNISYQQIIDFIYHEDSQFKVESPLQVKDINILSCIISNILDKFITRGSNKFLFNHESLEDMNYAYAIDLNTKEVSSDVSIFWEMCDCYE